MTVDELKRVDLVKLLGRAWALSFHREGSCFAALSPFGRESVPSFHVACAADGHWVYCDHSDGSSGSIIDLMMRRDQTRDFGLACEAARRLVQAAGVGCAAVPAAVPEPAPAGAEPDWEWLYRRLRSDDASPCRQYLTGRGLDQDLVGALIDAGLVVLNRMDGSRYCCFAVRDAAGGLRSLFNRRIDGPSEREKFLLGRQYPFCPDWEHLARADAVHLCEGIIDALSVLTLLPEAAVMALPGAQFDLSRLELPAGARLIEAFDTDAAGQAAARRLRERFPEHRIERFDLPGGGDVNECLQRRAWMSEEVRGTARLSARDRVAIAFSNRPSRELARQYGIHHSRVCDIRNEADAILAEVWDGRRPGRKPAPAPPEEAELTAKVVDLQRRLDLLTMRKEWLDLQLEMHERRDAEVESGEARRKRKKKARRKSP